jgi:hypothetical protein
MAETSYTVIGIPPNTLRPNTPWNNLPADSKIGDTITLDLSSEDETALIGGGVIEPATWHTTPEVDDIHAYDGTRWINTAGSAFVARVSN